MGPAKTAGGVHLISIEDELSVELLIEGCPGALGTAKENNFKNKMAHKSIQFFNEHKPPIWVLTEIDSDCSEHKAGPLHACTEITYSE